MRIEEIHTRYPAGTILTNYKRIDEISRYNFNYYNGIETDLLLGISDDDVGTDWYLIQGTYVTRFGSSSDIDQNQLSHTIAT